MFGLPPVTHHLVRYSQLDYHAVGHTSKTISAVFSTWWALPRPRAHFFFPLFACDGGGSTLGGRPRPRGAVSADGGRRNSSVETPRASASLRTVAQLGSLRPCSRSAIPA